MLVEEARQAIRSLRRNLSFVASCAALIGAGLGLSVAGVAVVDVVFLRPLHADRPNELLRVAQSVPRLGITSAFPTAYYDAILDASTLSAVAGEAGEFASFFLAGPERTEALAVRGVTSNFFDVFGVDALLGRTLAAVDADPDAPPAAVLSHRLWRRSLPPGGNPIGSTIVVNRRAFTVVGVMPEGFGGVTVDTGPDLWMSLSAYKSLVADPDDVPLQLTVRKNADAEDSAVFAQLQALWRPAMEDYYRNRLGMPAVDAARLVDRGIILEPLLYGVSVVRESYRDVILIAAGTSVLMLIAVCLTAASLSSMRTMSRGVELRVRVAVGATRLALLRQLWLENGLIVLCAGALGLAVAGMLMPLALDAMPLLRDRAGALIPVAVDTSMTGRVVLLAFLASVAVWVCLSVVSGIDLALLGTGSGLAERQPVRTGVRRVLVSQQVAVCTALLFLSVLFLTTFRGLRNTELGLDVDRVATFVGDAPVDGGADSQVLIPLLLERMRNLPGVEAASFSSVGVMRGRGVSWTIAPAGQRMTSEQFLNAAGNGVTLDYFKTMGIPLVEGRLFVPSDESISGVPIPAVVNATLASRFFPSTNPIGERFGPPREGIAAGGYVVVGVVRDSHYRSAREPVPPTFFVLSMPTDSFVLNVRTASDPAALLAAVQKEVRAIAPHWALREVRTLRDEVEQSVTRERVVASAVSLFGAAASIVAMAGIFGLLSYVVALRSRDLALRLALGAPRAHIAKTVASSSMAPVVAGIAVGLLAGGALGHLFEALLYDTSPLDPAAMVVTAAAVWLLSGIAAAYPTARAMRQEPNQLLRAER